MNRATVKAITIAKSLEEILLRATNQLSIIHHSEETVVHRVLYDVENTLQYVRDEIQKIKRPEAGQKVQEVKLLIKSLAKSLESWRLQYPDKSPVRIDNRRYYPFPFSLAFIIWQANLS